MVGLIELDLSGIVKSFSCAFRGVKHAWDEERNFRIQTCHLALVLILSAWLRPSVMDFGLVWFGALALLAAEMGNSALERTVDLVTKEHHALAKAAKDLAAGAVLLVSLGSGVVTVLVFAPYLDLGAKLGLIGAITLFWVWGRR